MSRRKPLASTLCSPCVDIFREIGVHLHRHTAILCNSQGQKQQPYAARGVQIKAVFDRCAELGVTLLNSAEFYGADRANERAIGANIAGRTDKFQVRRSELGASHAFVAAAEIQEIQDSEVDMHHHPMHCRPCQTLHGAPT